MSLLDDVSIVVTPNGYKAGELYAVVPVPTEGADVVVDGNFPLPNTAWSLTNATVEVNGGRINNTVTTGYSGVSQLLSGTVIGKQFVLTYDVIATNGKNLVLDNTTSLYLSTSTTGVNKKLYYTWGRGDNYLVIKREVADTDVTIDNVSVKEYTAADMDVTRATAATRVDEAGLVNYAEIVGSEQVTNGDFATDLSGWTITGTDATHTVTWTASGARFQSDTTSPVMEFKQLNLLTSSTQYVLTCNVTYTGSGTLKVNVGSNLPPLVEGSNTVYFTATSTTLSILRFNANVDAIISSVSVKEVTRDNVPRINYTGGGCPHILAEPQRTNTLTYSEDFSQWFGDNITLESNQLAPDGTLSATKVSGTIGVSSLVIASQSSVTATRSIYARTVSGNGTAKLMTYFGNTDNTFTLTEEWQRFELTGAIAAGGTNLYIDFRGSQSLSEVIVWGGQSEEDSYATSYIPTSGSTVTRNQDQFTRDGIGSLINSTEGVLFVEVATLVNSGSFRAISLNDGSESNRAMIRYESTENNMYFFIISGGVVQAETLIVLSDSTDFNKLAISWKLNEVKSFINGVQSGVTDTSATPPTGLNTLSFNDGNNNEFFGKVKQLQVYKTALTDEQLIQLTGTSGTDFYESYAEMASALTYTIQ